MENSRRQKRVANLIQAELSRILITFFQDSQSGLITVTRVEMSKDLRTARIFVRLLGAAKPGDVMAALEKKQGLLRKMIATCVKLKYNPLLIFHLDDVPDYEKRIDSLIESIKKDEK